MKKRVLTSTYCRAGFGSTLTSDSRFAVPCPSDRNALRNPPRQHVPTVVVHLTQLNIKNLHLSIKQNYESLKIIICNNYYRIDFYLL